MADSKREFEALIRRLAAPARLPSWHDAPTFPDGSLLDETYRVRRLLGRGGMGEVYEVEHLASGELLALKCLLPALAADAASHARFLAEAQTASRLGHCNIVRVVASGTVAGRPYLCMELLEGCSLQSRLSDQGPLPLELLVHVVAALCRALAAAHAHDIVHRDLKPANVFLVRPEGAANPLVKLTDFGVAKLLRNEAARVTTTGVTLGTPHFMAPEQVRAERDIDGRSDIYALGVLMYYCLSGVLPFEAKSFGELAVMICSAQPRPLETLRSDVSPELAAIVRCAMDKLPARRFAQVEALAEALAHAAPTPSS